MLEWQGVLIFFIFFNNKKITIFKNCGEIHISTKCTLLDIFKHTVGQSLSWASDL